MKQKDIEKIIEMEKNDTGTIESKSKPKKKKYLTQNRKIWTINFSSQKNVNRAKVVVEALMTCCMMGSKGKTVLLAVEYCMQERVIQDFLEYVNSRRRSFV